MYTHTNRKPLSPGIEQDHVKESSEWIGFTANEWGGHAASTQSKSSDVNKYRKEAA